MSIVFLVTALVVVVTPGTGVILTVGAALSRGRQAALVTAVGCTLGIVPHLAAAIVGAAALLRASGIAFEVVKFAGVAYLLALAIYTWREKSRLKLDTGQARPIRPLRMMVSAILANLLNPKLTLFFFALLPQFVPRHTAHPLAQLLLLSTVFMVMTLIVFAAYGVLAASVREQVLRRPSAIRRVRQVFAMSLVGLSARLAMTER